MNAQDFITEKYGSNNYRIWGFYPPSRTLVAEWLDEYAKMYHAEQIGQLYCDCTEPPFRYNELGTCKYCGKQKKE